MTDNVHQRMANRRRFYKKVGIEPVPATEGQATDTDTLYRITLDGRTLRTPARNDLHVSSW
jgi:chaperone required for assembly of F1-ATPase